MRFALVPLDDRPCHTRFPRRLAELGGVDLALPPSELLGRFLLPGRPDDVLDWLEAEAPRCDGVAVCGEMVVYGGLVAARTPTTTVERARQRVERLESLVRRLECPVALACGITRATITVASNEDYVIYEHIARYSELSDLAEGGDSDAQSELTKIVKLIPEGVLTPFLAARERNHVVNGAFVALGSHPSVRVVVLAQEDCKPHGLHRREQRAIMELRRSLGLEDKVLIHPGADEASVVLLARVILAAHGVRPRLRAEIVPAVGAGRVAPYEDRPVSDTLAGQLAAVGVDVAEADDAAAPSRQRIPVVRRPSPPAPLPRERGARAQRGRCEGGGRPAYRESALPHLVVVPPLHDAERDPNDHYGALREQPQPWVAEAIEKLRRAECAVGLADTCVDNGAYMPLLRAVRDAGLLDRLAVYSAWNTAGNTIGTAVAFMAVAAALGRLDSDVLRRFRAERMMDDAAYQALVRDALQQRLAAEGACIYHLDPTRAAEAEAWLRAELPHVAAAEGLPEAGASWDITLPWGRTFECDVALL